MTRVIGSRIGLDELEATPLNVADPDGDGAPAAEASDAVDADADADGEDAACTLAATHETGAITGFRGHSGKFYRTGRSGAGRPVLPVEAGSCPLRPSFNDTPLSRRRSDSVTR